MGLYLLELNGVKPNEGLVSAEQFRRAFVAHPDPWPAANPDRALVQLALPHAHGVRLWLAPARGQTLDPVVSLASAPPGVTQRSLRIGEQGTLRIEIDGLDPNTTYELTVVPGPEAAPRRLRATTAPTDPTQSFSFLATSCFSAFAAPRSVLDKLAELRWPFGTDIGAGPSIIERTARLLSLLVQRSHAVSEAPSFLLGLGDQVYVDTNDSIGQAMLSGDRTDRRHYAPRDVREFFETVYRATFALQPVDSALSTLPSALMWDDHEIRDGWGSHGDENDPLHDWRPHMQAARDFFVGWQAARNPPRRGVQTTSGELLGAMQLGPDLTKNLELDFHFDWGPHATFFVMDLRSWRNSSAGRIVSDDQLQRLESWFASRSDAPTVFVLGSTLPVCHPPRLVDRIQRHLLKFRRDDLADAWWASGPAKRRAELLALIHGHFGRHSRHRLIILSGDVHFSEVIELTDAGGRVFGHEVVSSGLAQTYFKLMRMTTQRDSDLGQGVRARGLGRFHGPAFAEIFVTPEADDRHAPRVEVTFHTSVTLDGRFLANTTPSTRRLRLPLTQLPTSVWRRAELFGDFVVADQPRRLATTIAAPPSRP